ncbi:MAG: carboxypeptidase-like regulatory domain-containing protein [Chitinophagales bacterium]
MKITTLALIILIGFSTFELFAQKKKKQVIQFSGVVLTSDSLQGIPYASVLIKGTGNGTIANHQGFFSLVANAGDSIRFSALGFLPNVYVIPDTLSDTKYSVIELLSRDTIYLPETVINPWPTPEQFRQAFLSLNISDDDWERARKNLDQERMKELGDIMAYDADENQDFYLRNEAYKYSYAGQVPPMNIFNPLAWSQFIDAWRSGAFKRDK